MIKLLVAIIDSKFRRSFLERLGRFSLSFTSYLHARGTATDDMLDLLGIGTSEKGLVLALGEERSIAALMTAVEEDRLTLGSVGGILFDLPLEAVANRVRFLVEGERQTESMESRTEREDPMQEKKNSLIMISVNQGYTDDVMSTAKAAGAAGGTVLKARLAETGGGKDAPHFSFQPEREILLILCSNSQRNAIMEAVNGKHGLDSKAQGILSSVGVDHSFKLA